MVIETFIDLKLNHKLLEKDDAPLVTWWYHTSEFENKVNYWGDSAYILMYTVRSSFPEKHPTLLIAVHTNLLPE